MGQKLIVGPIGKGLRTDVIPCNIDNDSFPTLINAFQWRGRVKRKRGTSLLNRTQRFFNSLLISYNTGSTTITLDGSGNGNLLTGFSITTKAPDAALVPGFVVITAPGPTVFTDPAEDGTLSPSGTINYSTGAISIPSQAGAAVSASFQYYPNLPIMGIEELVLTLLQYPGTLVFDPVYSYNILQGSPYNIYDVSFYKNPAADGVNLPGYVPKSNPTPTTWNGQDYQQFYTVNYQGALWATNGINVPFSAANVGMQYKLITNITNIVAGPPATAQLTIAAHGLVVGDFVFINEVGGVTGINFQTGYVITVVDAANVIVEFPDAMLGGAYTTGGIAQYLTSRSDPTKDSLRFYDGDPTNGNPNSPVLNGTHGWVNFAPPLSQNNYSIADLPAARYYLVGARLIVPYKDRLLFFGPVVQTSAAGSQVYLQDTVIYSQNGTPYYTTSYKNTPNVAIDTPASASNVFFPILLPINQTATSPAYFEDFLGGFGGFQSAGIDQPIITVNPNQDVLIVGFDRSQAKLVYSGNDLKPFDFYGINYELGSSSTFSSVVMDFGVLARGNRGFIVTSQNESKRFDLDIPDQVFEISLTNNGSERVCSQRDYINEWIYFTYPSDTVVYKFPNQSLFYNYRDQSFAIFDEAYTTYGLFRRQTGFIWSTVGDTYPTWSSWNDPWDAGESELLQTELIAGNQQGFVIFRDEGTNETNSLYIQNIVGNLVTSPDHCLDEGDFIVITGVLGTVSGQVNGEIFKVGVSTTDTFKIDITTTGTYLGSGVIKRMYAPKIQTKQFPAAWGMGRKTRIGVQQYLLTATEKSQITLLIFLSQNADDPYNIGKIVPESGTLNNSLIYSTVLYTCPESTNIGLTPFNSNLQTPTAIAQQRIWHRINTSLIGDTVQLGFTLSEAQMRLLDRSGLSFAITNITQTNPVVLTTTAQFAIGTLVKITGVEGMIQLNGNIYFVIASDPTTVTLNLDTTGFAAYISGGIATPVSFVNQFAEIELHGFSMDLSPSQMLV